MLGQISGWLVIIKHLKAHKLLTTSYGFWQIISERTYVLKNSSSYLIFTDQPSLIIDSGTHPSLHPNCQHKIIHCKIDLKIVYSPPYMRFSMGF